MVRKLALQASGLRPLRPLIFDIIDSLEYYAGSDYFPVIDIPNSFNNFTPLATIPLISSECLQFHEDSPYAYGLMSLDLGIYVPKWSQFCI